MEQVEDRRRKLFEGEKRSTGEAEGRDEVLGSRKRS